MHYRVQECPNCGYVAASLKNPVDFDKSYLETSEYRDFPDQPPASGLAQQFILKARISIKKTNHVQAFWDYLCAAWASDDKKDETWQTELRLLALSEMEKFNEKDMNDTYRVMRADLLRKSRQFDRVIQEYENAHFEDDLLEKITQFEVARAKAADTSTYTIQDIPPKKGPAHETDVAAQ